MANSGSFNTSNYEGRYLKFSWEVKSQSAADNTTTISWSLVGAGTGKSGYYTSGNFKVVIAGETVYSSSTRINLYNGTKVASGTKTIKHNSDGTKTFTAKAEAGIYYVAVNCSGSGSWSLPAIAAAPKFTNTPPNITNLTKTVTLKWSNPAKSKVSIGIYLPGGDAIAETYYAAGSSTTSHTFTITEAARQLAVEEAGGDLGDSCNIYYEIIDMNDRGESIQRTFTVLDDGSGGGGDDPGSGGLVYDVSFNPTVVDNNSTTIALTGNKNTLVKYHSDAYFTVNASTTSGVVIENGWQRCRNSGKTVIGSSGTINDAWDDIFIFEVQSSFIGYHTDSIVIPMVEYVPLTCYVSAGNPDTNGNLFMRINGAYFNGSFGAANNTLSLKYRYKTTTSSGYSSWIAVTPTISGNSYYANVNLTGLNYQSAYTIEVQATDKLETATGSTLDVQAKPVFSWSGEDFKFDVPVYADKILMSGGVENGIYQASSNGQEREHLRVDSGGNTYVGLGSAYDSTGSTGVYGQDVIVGGNNSLSLYTEGGDASISSGADVVISGDNIYVGDASTANVYIGGYNIAGAMRAMTTSYKLEPYTVTGANFSSATTTAYLLGNNLSGFLNCTRNSAYAEGNISPNETIVTVQIPHGGKIKTAYATSFSTADTGNLCSFYITSLSVTSTHINFNIVLSASAGSGKELTAYWCMPVVLNLDAF
jgi:hypothetical protein